MLFFWQYYFWLYLLVRLLFVVFPLFSSSFLLLNILSASFSSFCFLIYISFIIPLSKVQTFSALGRLRTCSFIRFNPMKLSSKRLLLSGLRMVLLPDILLSTLSLEFCNERQLFITFDNSVYFLSSPTFLISKTLPQYMSISFKFPSFF